MSILIYFIILHSGCLSSTWTYWETQEHWRRKALLNTFYCFQLKTTLQHHHLFIQSLVSPNTRVKTIESVGGDDLMSWKWDRCGHALLMLSSCTLSVYGVRPEEENSLSFVVFCLWASTLTSVGLSWVKVMGWVWLIHITYDNHNSSNQLWHLLLV